MSDIKNLSIEQKYEIYLTLCALSKDITNVVVIGGGGSNSSNSNGTNSNSSNSNSSNSEKINDHTINLSISLDDNQDESLNITQ
jgi:hypothetical protein